MSAVRKTFGAKVAVDDLDLAIPEGSLYGFIGPNGAGKTTTIRMIMSIIFPDRGEISVLGKASAVESKDRIGYLPEERGLYRKMRVGAFLEYMARLKGAGGPGLSTTVREALARVGLADVIRKKCMELSKGMQQKVQFLSSILHDPELVILDEPFSGLDPVNARLMRDMIREMHERGTTVIFSTHVMEHAEQICDHIVMINKGVKVLDSSMDVIRERFDPRTIVVEPLTGSLDGVASIPGVKGVRREASAHEVDLADDADPAAVMRAIMAGVTVRRIELRRASLEDVFIGIVEGTQGLSEQGGAETLRSSLRETVGGVR